MFQSEGLFDKVPTAKIKDAQADLLTRLWSRHKEDMRELNKGEKKFAEYERSKLSAKPLKVWRKDLKAKWLVLAN